ncbi:interleukin-11 receptor subunit alpha isoform X1 [Oxyura jamaicensis]|uniref:interleukin-11 receptor subunit alpha isoform X1 n=2 Tax=Oxyura jamaicensis TaxID=8884 RepID=UPI0015A639F8|nr:interleukin-11 receptor subunit alpha isoform X1 [Oxyura jamaicensis]
MQTLPESREEVKTFSFSPDPRRDAGGAFPPEVPGGELRTGGRGASGAPRGVRSCGSPCGSRVRIGGTGSVPERRRRIGSALLQLCSRGGGTGPPAAAPSSPQRAPRRRCHSSRSRSRPAEHHGHIAAEERRKMHSPTRGLGRVMVFLAAALASASLAVPEGWGEEGVQYGQVGTDVTLSCAGARAGSPVQWRREGAAALPEGSAIRQGALVLPHASLAATGTYSCHGEDGSLLHAVSLRLGHLPGVPFVSCRASDYENFSCSWTSSLETFLPTRYITTYRKKSLTGEEKRRNKSGHVGPCLQDPSRAGTCTVHRSEFWSSYRLNITEVNPLGSSFRLLDITMQAIIKPDPPEGLVVEPVPLAPRRLYVSWKYPASWPKEPHFQLRFRLQYRPVIHRSWSVVETVNLSEVITDAFAGLEHVVQVSAKDFLDAGNWSEWSAEARATPVRDPATTASEGTTTDASLESLAEEPSQAPNPEPINRSDPLERMAILVSLGIFAFFILAAVLVITILIWLRMRKHSKDETKPHNFLVAATHLKALPRTQILP